MATTFKKITIPALLFCFCELSALERKLAFGEWSWRRLVAAPATKKYYFYPLKADCWNLNLGPIAQNTPPSFSRNRPNSVKHSSFSELLLNLLWMMCHIKIIIIIIARSSDCQCWYFVGCFIIEIVVETYACLRRQFVECWCARPSIFLKRAEQAWSKWFFKNLFLVFKVSRA